jgi:hypothetical protein
VQQADELSAELRQEAAVTFSAGVEFVSVEDVEDALSRTTLSADEQAAVLGAYEDAQLGGLRKGMLVLALVVVGTLFATGRLPRDPLTQPDDEEEVPAPVAVPS